MTFKLIYPSGYKIEDVLNDNIDINIITEDGNVFFGTFFTQLNIDYLMLKESEHYFWATDMIIIKDLQKTTIINVIKKIIVEGYLGQIFTKIGSIEEVYRGQYSSFTEIESLDNI
jgi:hypothetical protein